MNINKGLFLIFLLLPFFAISRDGKSGAPAEADMVHQKTATLDEHSPDWMPGMIVLKLREEMAPLSLNKTTNKTQYASLNDKIDFFNVRVINKVFPEKRKPFKMDATDLSSIYYFRFDAARDAREVARGFLDDPSVLYAEPVYLYETFETPDDPQFGNQEHFAAVQAEQGWDITTGSPDVIVGIVDSGVDLDHPDLQANIWINEDEIADNGIDDDANGYVDDVYGWDFIGASFDNIQPDNDPDQNTGSSHGTHVAGIAAAVGNNGLGITGMGWNLKIMVTKNSSDDDSRSIGFGYQGIVYCADNGADIINCSWGGGGYSDFANDIINYAYEKGAVVVAAAGNDSPGATYDPPDIVPPHYPSAYDHVISVAATDNADNVTGFSYYGTTIDVTAPGYNILSTIPVDQGSYGRLSGTSMASPLVAGLAGLVKSIYPDWTNDQVASQVIYTADNIDSLFYNPRYAEAGGIGTGRVNAYRALSEDALPVVELISVFFDDSLSGNNNGKPEAGERIDLRVAVRNVWGDAEDVAVALYSDDYAIQIDDNASALGTVAGGTRYISNDDDLISFLINDESLPHRVPFTLQITTSNGFQYEREIFMSIDPMVLLVDDDDGSNNVDPYYTSALDRMGVVYEVWDHVLRGAPRNVLTSYPNVIWLCEWTFPSLDQADREAITAYLQQGGRFFLSGQDIGWDLGDASGAGVPNEYGRSDGASEDFLMDWLKAEYIRDDSDYSTLAGVAGDPIGDGLEFEVNQPGRAPDQQFPSEIEPLDGAVPVFEFGNGNAGGIRYDGMYKLVFFAFGGYEAISDSSDRQIVMERLLNWMNGLGIDHEPLRDTEETENPYPVSVTILSDTDSIETVDLHWDTDGLPPYNKIPMSDEGDGRYVAEIPAQAGGDVQYLIFAKTVKGTYLPLKINSFRVGPDEMPPVIEIVNTPNATTVNPFGPHSFRIRSFDNIGVDSTATVLYYWLNEGNTDSLKLRLSGSDLFEGELNFDPPLTLGEELFYRFRIQDLSGAGNITFSDTFSFTIDTVEVLDGFEGNLSEWTLGEGWGKSTRQHEGIYSITESPEGKYENNMNSAITYRYTYNLTSYQAAWLEYWVQYNLEEDRDFVYLEISADGGASWDILQSYTDQKRAFRYQQVFLNAYTGEGADSIQIRFRIETDSMETKDGFYLDDVMLYTSFSPVTSIDQGTFDPVPQQYYLKQNYPNPFNPVTTIEFGMKAAGKVKLRVYNVLGQEIAELTDTEYLPGRYRIRWDGRNGTGSRVASGIYVYRLEIDSGSGDNRQFIRKMILLQ